MLIRKTYSTLILLAFAAVPTGAQSTSFAVGGDAVRWEAPSGPTLPAGTILVVSVTDTITSRSHNVGDAVSATVIQPVVDTGGRVAIPTGAVVLGVISDITADDDGRLELTFYGLTIGEKRYPVQARVISLPTRKQRRGNLAGDVAKVGAGTLLGGIAGRIIGGDKRGTLVGGATGAAAGVAAAAATRREDIVIDAGTPIILMLTTPLAL